MACFYIYNSAAELASVILPTIKINLGTNSHCLNIVNASGVLDSVEAAVSELRITLNARIDELKYNDFAHLGSAFEALTYVLEKNGSISKEDKEYVDGRLAIV